MTKDWVQRVGHAPVCQTLLQIVVRAVITASPPAWTSSAGMLSPPADFPFFNSCKHTLHFHQTTGWTSGINLRSTNTPTNSGGWLLLMEVNSRRLNVHTTFTIPHPQGEEDMLAEGQHSIVLHIAWFTERLLQLLLHLSRGVQQVNLGVFVWGAHLTPSQSWHWEYHQHYTKLQFATST